MTVTKVPFVDLKAQIEPFMDEIDKAISNVVQNTAFILGGNVSRFEENFAAFTTAKYAIGVDNGTSALELALRALNIGPGDEVITAANTFIATVLAISYNGATPILVDCDPVTHTIDVEAAKKAITPKTKAIIPVHLYGHPADMDPILELAKQHNLVVVEDACQAHGATYKGRPAGTMGDAAAFSFYPAKNLGAFGDAGMVTTGDEQVAETIRILRNVGQSKKYHHDLLGYNHRIDSLQAAILDVKLKHLAGWNEARRKAAALYNELLAGSGVIVPETADYAVPVWHLYVIRVNQRDALIDFLSERNIGAGIHYPIPIHLQPAYAHLGLKAGAFPVTETIASQLVSLPMFETITAEQIEYVVDAVREFMTANDVEPLA
ncbi:MAG: DegT/DnrJ/EryC1/StrS family aminotransferase [Anaerolineae bacterium]|nr:DegT/DnrJ/EryC1/StrS family aminotransferase [Anaerolineae bacterium]